MTCAADCLILLGAIAHDGDTLTIPGPNVRLWGMSTPELDEPGGKEARAALATLIAGQRLTCERKGKSYDRIVARCETAEGVDLSCAMIRSGHGVETRRYSKGAYAGCGR